MDALIWIIAAREILDNLMSMKFLLGTVLCLALVVIGTVVSLQDYQTRMEEYDRTVADFNENAHYSTVRIMRRPEVLSIFAHGFDKRLGNVVWSVADTPTWGNRIGISAFAQPLGDEPMYRLITGFASSIDLVFVIRVMVSLLAIFLSYDTISGEYERGTLKLTLSRPVSRASVILGKLIAGAVCLLVPLVMSFIIGLLIIHLMGGIGFTSEDSFRVASILGISILCVMGFYMLGVVVSSRTRRAATSLLILLLIWISWVFLIPGITVSAMGRYRLISSHPGQEIRAIKSDYTRWVQENPLPDGNKDLDGYIRSRARRAEAWDEMKQNIWSVQRQNLNRLYSQAGLVRWICRILPSESYAYAVESMARTDVEAYRHFMRYTRSYHKAHREYVKQFQKKLDKLRWTDWDRYLKERDKKHEEYGKTVESPTIHISASFRAAVLDICLLIVLNVMLFMLAVLFFIRYDVH